MDIMEEESAYLYPAWKKWNASLQKRMLIVMKTEVE